MPLGLRPRTGTTRFRGNGFSTGVAGATRFRGNEFSTGVAGVSLGGLATVLWSPNMTRSSEKARARDWAHRVAYADLMSRLRPPSLPATRGPDVDEEARFAAWLWVMAQPLLGLDREQAGKLAEQFDLRLLERPIDPTMGIWGEAYSAPGTIAVQYDAAHRLARVAVEGVWPNVPTHRGDSE